MILIHGGCGSGKSAALRALEAEPPAGLRAVYVPVPTLDFAGLARWCLDRLSLSAAPDPVSALRSIAQRQRIALLVDDADLVPLDAALALRHLERESGGSLTIVAACESQEQTSASILALGAPLHAITLARGKSTEAAAAVRDKLALAQSAPVAAVRRPAPTPPVPAPARAPAAAREEPRPAVPEPQPAPVATTLASAPAARAAAAASRRVAADAPALPISPPPAVRTVPLSLALALAITAFLVPAAFFAGYLLGGARERAPASEARAAALPDVAAAAPTIAAAAQPPARVEELERESPATPARLEASAPRKRDARAEAPAPTLAVSDAVAPAAAPRADVARDLAPPAAAATAPTPVRARPSAAERKPEPAPVQTEQWGAPVLISVEPGAGRP
ncbi:MAG TPA: ATP-binding protein [Myxococcota bacterium]